MRAMVDEVLESLSPPFDRMYAREGRPSIAPEKLLRAQLLQMLYSIRSERLLMEKIDYSDNSAGLAALVGLVSLPENISFRQGRISLVRYLFPTAKNA